jgi:hypothetical protein
MRIKRRRGSLSVESVMLIPIAVVIILLTRMLLEASLARQEIAVYARSGTHSAAALTTTSVIGCSSDLTAFAGRQNVTQVPSLNCQQRDAERGLQQERPFWDAVESGASSWRTILRDVKPSGTLQDMQGDGSGTLNLYGPAFLQQQKTVNSANAHLAPQNIRWGDDDRSFARGHDSVIWDELQKRGTYRLFPEVFPSR